jgi:DNA invertase Pin-like site-specific DNA recombinase
MHGLSPIHPGAMRLTCRLRSGRRSLTALRRGELETLATQSALLKDAGVKRIFSENVSGVATRRPGLERALDELEAGDVLVVAKLDRLARSTLDLLRIIDLIGKECAGFKIAQRSLG